MFVKLNLSPDIQEEFIEINAKRKTQAISSLTIAVSQLISTQQLIGYQNQRRKAISFYQVVRIFTENRQLICQTLTGYYRIHYRLYELKELLPSRLFIQISSSEIVNLSQIKDFSLSKTGIYQVELLDGSQTFTSRRYAQKIRRGLLK